VPRRAVEFLAFQILLPYIFKLVVGFGRKSVVLQKNVTFTPEFLRLFKVLDYFVLQNFKSIFFEKVDIYLLFSFLLFKNVSTDTKCVS